MTDASARRPDRIIIAAGGTGGHVFPALAVAEELRDAGAAISWLGTATGLEAKRVPQAGIEFLAFRVGGLRGRGVMKLLTAPFMLLRSLAEALVALRRQRPDVVLGMGGYVSGPVGLAAWLLRVPLVIHEQNAIPGTTNRLLAPLARVVFEAFPGSFEARHRAVHCGNPLRRAFLEPHGAAGDQEPHRTDGFRLLVLGGSQGAMRLNEIVPEALEQLDGELAFEVHHQAGPRHQAVTEAAYAKAGVPCTVMAFIEDMPAQYRWADLVVCRAGAMTVAELAQSAVAAILVPFPYAVDDHQTANARFLADRDAAVVVQQADLSPGTLARLLEELVRAPGRLLAMGQAARSAAMPDAAGQVARRCLELAHA